MARVSFYRLRCHPVKAVTRLYLDSDEEVRVWTVLFNPEESILVATLHIMDYWSVAAILDFGLLKPFD